jgi:GAF domain-containing protein
LNQRRNLKPSLDFKSSSEVRAAQKAKDVVAEESIPRDIDQVGALEGDSIQSRLIAPIRRGEDLVGLVSLEQSQRARSWSKEDIAVAKRAQNEVLHELDASKKQELTARSEDIREDAVVAILGRLRLALKAQRCTYRQDLVPGYAFAVAYEAREPAERSLYGDFTIVQSGQPVIQKMLAERLQVVQGDTSIASDDPLFHVMLKHYGGMRAQIVTPVIEDSKFAGALSVHDLRGTREWTKQEMNLAQNATNLIAAIVRVPLT